MHIGSVAKKIGLTPDAIRFYERSSLLPRAPRTQGGFRQYGETDIETLTFIRRAQSLGFRLREIRSMLDLRRGYVRPCAQVRGRLQTKLADVRKKLASLKKLERDLLAALHSCNRELRNRSPHCPILPEVTTKGAA